ncbi:MAG: hypothetical protein JW963_01040 [Anaerolineales bacterium]|nr:hypothetical protein [Anaerolineales bacterium]
MLKKMVFWGLYASFLGILLAGAAYRTSVKLADGGQEQNQGNASRQQPAGETVLEPAVDSQSAKEHESEIKENSVINGQVLNISNRGLSMQLPNGQILNVSGRAWRYAQGFGFSAQNGDILRLEGFDENGHFEITRMTNLNNAQSVALRDGTGHPLWNGN